MWISLRLCQARDGLVHDVWHRRRGTESQKLPVKVPIRPEDDDDVRCTEWKCSE